MKERRISGWLVSSLVGLVGLAVSPAWGAGTNVSIVDFAFSPTAVTISPNDSVTWTWAGSFAHSSTSNDTNLWDSGILSHGATFSHTFKSAGSFPYHCLVHASMTASVTVRAPTTGSITLGSAHRASVGSFQFTYSATPGLNYAVERSLDLRNWTPLNTNNASSSQITFTDNAAAGSANFYRVRFVSGP